MLCTHAKSYVQSNTGHCTEQAAQETANLSGYRNQCMGFNIITGHSFKVQKKKKKKKENLMEEKCGRRGYGVRMLAEVKNILL